MAFIPLGSPARDHKPCVNQSPCKPLKFLTVHILDSFIVLIARSLPLVPVTHLGALELALHGQHFPGGFIFRAPVNQTSVGLQDQVGILVGKRTLFRMAGNPWRLLGKNALEN